MVLALLADTFSVFLIFNIVIFFILLIFSKKVQGYLQTLTIY